MAGIGLTVPSAEIVRPSSFLFTLHTQLSAAQSRRRFFLQFWEFEMNIAHQFVRFVVVACALSALAGCGSSEDSARAHAAEARSEQERQSRRAAEEALKAAQKALHEAEKARQGAQASASYWRTATWLASFAGFGLLFVGTALGSSSRKDAVKRGSQDA